MLHGIAKFFRQRFGNTDDREQKLHLALENYRNPEADALELTRHLIALLRPANIKESATGERQKALLASLQADPELLAAFRHHIVHFIATRRLVTFLLTAAFCPGPVFSRNGGVFCGTGSCPRYPMNAA
ncbi:MAG: hypothetical protein IPJ38_09100 [Dechloromonas sp.]|uniref:Uncharacterized protein n=1 Tax=Candidatus Dechloromonas phosphorivorans TaxID=2899244 RepID=A0A935JXY3_9RHOO|nr:hypothetical protein [Candidatus Dechloromonas phosphorivorans]